MWRGHLFALLMVAVVLLFQGSFAERAAAQDGRPLYTRTVGQPAGISDVAALFMRPSVPVRLYSLDGPELLSVGEDGRFAALANIDAASLPLRVQWDFGDGNFASGLHALHRYAAPGTYSVTITLANDHGEVADTLTVTVVDNKPAR